MEDQIMSDVKISSVDNDKFNALNEKMNSINKRVSIILTIASLCFTCAVSISVPALIKANQAYSNGIQLINNQIPINLIPTISSDNVFVEAIKLTDFLNNIPSRSIVGITSNQVEINGVSLSDYLQSIPSSSLTGSIPSSQITFNQVLLSNYLQSIPSSTIIGPITSNQISINGSTLTNYLYSIPSSVITGKILDTSIQFTTPNIVPGSSIQTITESQITKNGLQLSNYFLPCSISGYFEFNSCSSPGTCSGQASLTSYPYTVPPGVISNWFFSLYSGQSTSLYTIIQASAPSQNLSPFLTVIKGGFYNFVGSYDITISNGGSCNVTSLYIGKNSVIGGVIYYNHKIPIGEITGSYNVMLETIAGDSITFVLRTCPGMIINDLNVNILVSI